MFYNSKVDGVNIFKILRRCVERSQGIGDTCSYALANLIIKETKYDDFKRKLVLDYLKQYLTVKERDYLYRNPNDIKTVVKFATSKFSVNGIPDINNVNYKDAEIDLRVVDIEELLSLGWRIEDYICEVRKIWLDIVGDMPEEYIGDVDKWIQIINDHPESRKVLLTGKNELVGYWEFDPLFDEAFKKAKEGELLEGDMTINDIPYLIPGVYNIYFENICISNNYKKTITKSLALKKMIFSIIDTLEELARNDTFINEICTWAYTESGIVLCKSLGLKYYKDHEESGEVYCGTIYDLLNHPICNDFTKIKELYKVK